MNFYLNPNNSANQLIEEYNKYGTLVIAFDLDDTVCDFHKKGRIHNDVIKLLQEKNIPFDAFIENQPFHKTTNRKVYSNAYLEYRAGLKQVFDQLNNLALTIKTKNI